MNAISFSKILGFALVVIGIAGFFTGNTLIVFEVSDTHNIVHIVSGILALIASARGGSRFILLLLGFAFTAVTAIGFMRLGDIYGYATINTANTFLYIIVALGCLYFGLTSNKT